MKLIYRWDDYPTIDKALPRTLTDEDLNLMISDFGGGIEFNTTKKHKREWLYLQYLTNDMFRPIPMKSFKQSLLDGFQPIKANPCSTPEPQNSTSSIESTHAFIQPLDIVPTSRIAVDDFEIFGQPVQENNESYYEIIKDRSISPTIRSLLPNITKENLISEIYTYELPPWVRNHQRDLPYVGQEVMILGDVVSLYLAQVSTFAIFARKIDDRHCIGTIQAIVLIDPDAFLYCLVTNNVCIPWFPRLVGDFMESIIPARIYDFYKSSDIHIGSIGEVVYATEDQGVYSANTYRCVCLTESRDGDYRDSIDVVFLDDDGNFTTDFTNIPIWDFAPISIKGYFPKASAPPFLAPAQWNSIGYDFHKAFKAAKKEIKQAYPAGNESLINVVTALSLNPASLKLPHVVEQLSILLDKRGQSVEIFFELVEEEYQEMSGLLSPTSEEILCMRCLYHYFKEILLPVFGQTKKTQKQ